MGVSDMNSQLPPYVGSNEDATENTRYVSPMESELMAFGNTIAELSDAIDQLKMRLEPVRRMPEYLEGNESEAKDAEETVSEILKNVRDKREWVNRLIFRVQRMTSELDV